MPLPVSQSSSLNLANSVPRLFVNVTLIDPFFSLRIYGSVLLTLFQRDRIFVFLLEGDHLFT